MRQTYSTIVLVLLAVFLGACDSSAELEKANNEVSNIRSIVRESGFEAMYDNASTDFKRAASRKKFADGLNEYRELIGSPESFTYAGSQVSYDPFNGRRIEITFVPTVKSKLSREKYRFGYEAGKLKLISYIYTERTME